jgi:hypothetical protein
VGFVEVEPVEYKKNGITVWKYSEIDTYQIEIMGGARGLKDCLNSLIPTNGHWEVDERDDDYYATYVKSDGTRQPTLIIDSSGTILCDEKNWKKLDHQYIRHQASILVSLLKKLRLIATAKKYFSFRKYGDQIREDIPDFYHKKLT